MKLENPRRLLGMAHECQALGWKALVQADAELLMRSDMGAEGRAVKLAAEARGHFRDAVKLLDEVVGGDAGGCDSGL